MEKNYKNSRGVRPLLVLDTSTGKVRGAYRGKHGNILYLASTDTETVLRRQEAIDRLRRLVDKMKLTEE